MKVLFIGGTGNISSACSELAIRRGIDLYHLNRGKSAGVHSVVGAKTIIADIRNVGEARKAIEGHRFDVVVDFIAFEPEHIQAVEHSCNQSRKPSYYTESSCYFRNLLE